MRWTIAAIAHRGNAGATWKTPLQRGERITEMPLRKNTLTEAQRAGLRRANATRRDEERDAQWWSLPAQGQRL